MASRKTRRRRGRLVLAMGVGLAFCTLLIFAYTPLQDDVNSIAQPARWQGGSVTWNLNPSVVGAHINATGGDTPVTVINNSFNTWKQSTLSGQLLSALMVMEGADSTAITPNASDCLNVVGFVDSTTSDFPTGTIAFTAIASDFGPPPTKYSCTSGGMTTTQTCNLPSCIVDADIEFNPKEQFSTTTPPLTGDFDLQSVATHEIGHFLGLDHSGIAHAVMFPFGDTGLSQQRTLAIDDKAGIAFLYPKLPDFSTMTGTVSGQVTQGGTGIFASHVVLIDATTGAAVVDGLTAPDGTYTLIGVPPGNYNVLALPLAPNLNSGIYTLDDFSGWSCGYAGITESSPPCCDPAKTGCTGKPLVNPTNYTGKFF